MSAKGDRVSVSITPLGPKVAQLRDLCVQKTSTDASFTASIGRNGSLDLSLGDPSLLPKKVTV